MAGKKWNMVPMWKKLMKHVDIEEPTAFLAHVYLGCIQRECKPNETLIAQFTKIFESSISAGATEKLPGWDKPPAKTSAWSQDMLENVLIGTANWQTKRRSNFSKFRILVWTIINSSIQAGRTRISGGLSEFFSQIVLTCLYVARIGRPDIPWSANKLAQSVTFWTGASDERLSRLISYFHHTNDCRQHCHVGHTAQHCRLGLCQDSDFAGRS